MSIDKIIYICYNIHTKSFTMEEEKKTSLLDITLNQLLIMLLNVIIPVSVGLGDKFNLMGIDNFDVHLPSYMFEG
jgi:hypothetical protein